MALPVIDYPDYLVYEDGRIWSNKTNKFLKVNITKAGYETVELFNESGSKRLLVHRLVAMAFIPNPNNYPQVNHIDENKQNNAVENLEWCTAKYNMNYGNGAKARRLNIDYTKPIYKKIAVMNGKKASRPVMMLNSDGACIKVFDSAVEASLCTGIYKTNITRSARSNHLKAGGYKWEYAKRGNDLSACQ